MKKIFEYYGIEKNKDKILLALAMGFILSAIVIGLVIIITL